MKNRLLNKLIVADKRNYIFVEIRLLVKMKENLLKIKPWNSLTILIFMHLKKNKIRWTIFNKTCILLINDKI